MNDYPFLTGLLSVTALAVLSFVAVFGTKALLVFLGIDLKKRKEEPPKEKPPVRRRRQTGRTIIINPDDVSRIFVKREND
ncbi:MAG: hypothetical protein MJ072_00595 [Clostridia bacterium]|nr:hypothetical protein [Clostridia bacterium]